MDESSERPGGLLRALRRVDPLVWAILASGSALGLLLLLAFSAPPDAGSLSLDMHEISNRYVMTQLAPSEEASVPNWLKAKGGPIPDHYAEYVPEDKRLARRMARSSGVLGLLRHQGGSGMASVFGRDANAALLGDKVGEAYGHGGLGAVGRGRRVDSAAVKDGPPAVTDKKTRVQGSLDRAIIRQVIRQHIDEVRQCYHQASVSSGRTDVQFTIAATGQVVASTVSTASPQLERCVAAAVQRWRFPRPKGGGMVVVSYPFLLRSAGGEGPAQQHQESPPSPAAEPPRTLAQAFWAERNRTDLERFQSPTGYWENTYIPGDPTLRLLRSQIAAFDRGQLRLKEGQPPRLDAAARPCDQSFDQPRGAALNLSLAADRRAVQGPARTLVQVGLQGTSRYGGRRPEMNVAVVLDWRPSTGVETSAAVRALLLALAQARDIGDRFTLTIAGQPGLTVPASDFRHGPLVLALQQLADRTASNSPLSLSQALERAGSTFNLDDSATALTGNLILLVVTGRINQHLPDLDRLVHRHAVAGVPTSVVAVGPDVDNQQLSKLVLSGQGNRRVLSGPSRAAELVDRELSAAASVVARALRLHVRLAPGVKLVDVLGSRSLDQAATEQVREAEQSIDLRVARNLGLAADRGKDDEGIQIVIPGYHAGDAHVVLLDVVVPGPGPVAEVTVRYKDLVYMRNSTSRARLTLARGTDRPGPPASSGPLELAVLKNLLSYRSAVALRAAAALMHRGQREQATARIDAWRQMLSSLRIESAGLTRDADIERDLTMLAEYIAVLRSSLPDARQRMHVERSLQYAGYLKVMPLPHPGAPHRGARNGIPRRLEP